MQTLGLDEENPIKAERPFWRRQFQPEATEAQNSFDWIFGVLLPVACFFFDPGIFRSSHGDGLLTDYKTFAYLLSYASVMAMIAWLLMGAKLRWLTPFLSGLFGVSSIVSLAIGLFLLPFSLLGLVVLIGALGFTPLFTAFVFLRNSIRALNIADRLYAPSFIGSAVVLSVAWSIAVPFVANAEISRLVNEIATGDPRTITAAAAKIKYVAPIANLGPVINRYKSKSPEEIDSLRMETMNTAFHDLTGESIDEYSRLCFLCFLL